MATSDVVAMDMSEDEINTVTEVMSAFTVTKSQRQGIMGRSQAVGWTDFRVRKRISQETLKPHMVHLQLRINAIITKHFPEFMWTTLMLNDGVKCQAHRDKGNVGMSVALVVMPPSPTPDAPAGVATAGQPGQTAEGEGVLVYVDEEDDVIEVVAGPGQIAMFSGHRLHRNTDYGCKRFSIIAFHHKSFKYATETAKHTLTSLGYQLPVTAPPGPSPTPDAPVGSAFAYQPGARAEGEGDDDDGDEIEDIWADDDDIHVDFALQMENTQRRVDDAIDLMIKGVLDVVQSSRGEGTGKGDDK